jgi:hypothetical protein
MQQLEQSPIAVSDSGDHDMFAHYVDSADMIAALVDGVPIMALCGKIWVPSRDPQKYPVCPTCLETYNSIVGDKSTI